MVVALQLVGIEPEKLGLLERSYLDKLIPSLEDPYAVMYFNKLPGTIE